MTISRGGARHPQQGALRWFDDAYGMRVVLATFGGALSTQMTNSHFVAPA
jgi:hypothetical protein